MDNENTIRYFFNENFSDIGRTFLNHIQLLFLSLLQEGGHSQWDVWILTQGVIQTAFSTSSSSNSKLLKSGWPVKYYNIIKS